MNYEHLCLHYMNYEKNENVCSQCMNYETILFVIHELWKCPFEHMNYENRKISVCNKWIMKKLKCLFAKHELWTSLFALHELWKYLFAIHE